MGLSSPGTLVGICNYINKKEEEKFLWLFALKPRSQNC